MCWSYNWHHLGEVLLGFLIPSPKLKALFGGLLSPKKAFVLLGSLDDCNNGTGFEGEDGRMLQLPPSVYWRGAELMPIDPWSETSIRGGICTVT